MIPNSNIRPLELVISAIHCLKEKNGSSTQNIIRFLQSKYNLHTDSIKPHVQAGLKRGLTFGLITFNSGLYRLNNSIGQIPGCPHLASGDTNRIKPRQKKRKRQLKKQSIRRRTGMKRIRVLHRRKRTKRRSKKQKRKHVFLGQGARCTPTKRGKEKGKKGQEEIVTTVKTEKEETEAVKNSEAEHPSVSTKKEEKGTPSKI